MNRLVEPELMSEAEQAKAYAEADFESAHSSYPKLFAKEFPTRPKKALVLDLGCGPADVTIRFAKANPGYKFHGVDGSAAMLKLGRAAVKRERLQKRIELIEGFIPGAPIPAKSYDVIISTSFLHHLHDPQVLWKTVKRFSRPGTIVFIVDLRRPRSRKAAWELVDTYSTNEPEVLRQDFYNSLRAAFVPQNIIKQLTEASIAGLKVRQINDRHLIVFGKIE